MVIPLTEFDRAFAAYVKDQKWSAAEVRAVTAEMLTWPPAKNRIEAQAVITKMNAIVMRTRKKK